MQIRAQEVVDEVNVPSELDTVLNMSVDEALSMALSNTNGNKELSPEWYENILSKLGETEKTAFTLALASEGIKVMPKEETKMSEKASVNKMKFMVMSAVEKSGYITEDEYNDICYGADTKDVGKLVDWMFTAMIPMKKNPTRFDKNNDYRKKVKDIAKHPDVKKLFKPKVATEINPYVNDNKVKVENKETEFLPEWERKASEALDEVIDMLMKSGMTEEEAKDVAIDYVQKNEEISKNAQYLDSEKAELAETVRKRQDQIPNWKQLLHKIQKAMDFSEIREIWDSLKEVPAFACDECGNKYSKCTAKFDTRRKISVKADGSSSETFNSFDLFVAGNDEQKTEGLQNFESLKNGEGMLFGFDHSSHVTFHMGKVKFPIDILFLLDDGIGNMKVTKIAHSIQPGETDHFSCSDCSCVIELSGGVCTNNGIKVGSACTLVKE